MKKSFVRRGSRQMRSSRMGISLAALTIGLGVFPVLTLATQQSDAATPLPLLGSCDPAVITSASSAPATAEIPFAFTVTTCATAVPVFKASRLPSGLAIRNNNDDGHDLGDTRAARQ